MGTNYYFQYYTENGRAKDLHIGKKSAGWQFSFRGYCRKSFEREIKSFADWKLLFSSLEGEIFNEYDEKISLKDFLKIVENSKREKYNHTTYCKKYYSEYAKRCCWLDEEGWSFSNPGA